MKHNLKITIVLIAMFFIAQLIGIFVASVYAPEVQEYTNPATGVTENRTVHDIPYGLEPPDDVNPANTVWQIVIALVIAVVIMLVLMRYKAETFLRLWFFAVVTLGIALALNAFLNNLENSALIALAIAFPLAFFKVFKRNLIVHNTTELLVYPGIAAVFIPLLNVWTVVLLLILISVYDIYAVWHAGFMQKMARYQIEKLKVFSGFFVPYVGRKERARLKQAKKNRSKKGGRRRAGVNVAILGGGDVVFPMILAGVVLRSFNIFSAVIIAIGATAALAWLFYISKKGKFYPAMPFISAGCLIALGVVFLV